MATFVVKHLVEKNNGRFAYRRRVPRDVQDIVGKREWKHAYPKGIELARAQALTVKYDQQHDADLRIAYSKLGKPGSAKHEFTPEIYQAAVQYVEEQGLKGRNQIVSAAEYEFTVADAWMERHLEQDHGEGPHGYATKYSWDSPFSEAVFHALQENAYPEDRELTIQAVYELDIEARDIAEDKALNYAVKSFVDLVGNLDIRHITWSNANQWKKQLQKSGIKQGTIARRAGALKAMTTRAFRLFGISKDNAFSGLGIAKGHSAESRLPFSKEHLDKIDHYLGNSRIDAEVALIINVLKLTGARLGEITGLVVRDVKLNGNVPHLLIRSNYLRDLKTKVSERSVPINSPLKKSLKEHLEGKDEADPVFRENNRKTNNISAKINKAIRASGVPVSPKLVAYSYRHTMKEAMRCADVPVEDQWTLLGHTNPTMAGKYGSPKRDLSKLKRHMDKAIKCLGQVPEGTHDIL